MLRKEVIDEWNDLKEKIEPDLLTLGVLRTMIFILKRMADDTKNLESPLRKQIDIIDKEVNNS